MWNIVSEDISSSDVNIEIVFIKQVKQVFIVLVLTDGSALRNALAALTLHTTVLVLSVVPGHSDQFVPKSANKDFPQPLTSLKSLKYVEMQYHDLLKACESVSLNITQKMVECVEAAARDQSKSKLWYKYRAGRITV